MTEDVPTFRGFQFEDGAAIRSAVLHRNDRLPQAIGVKQVKGTTEVFFAARIDGTWHEQRIDRPEVFGPVEFNEFIDWQRWAMYVLCVYASSTRRMLVPTVGERGWYLDAGYDLVETAGDDSLYAVYYRAD